MKNMKKLIIIFVMLLFVSLLPTVNVQAEESHVTGTTYYVSSLKGDDKNSGTSKDKPWQTLNQVNDLSLKPGDRVLLENGSIFQDQYIHLKGSGAANEPIILSAYGDSSLPKPLINTNGEGIWYQDYGRQLDSPGHKYKGYVSTSILLYDVEYIEVSDIAMTNKSLRVDSVYNKTDYMNRTGVAVISQNKGTLEHVYLDNLEIRDVIGNVYDKHMNNGGIYFTSFLPTDEAKTGISRYNDVKITNNVVENVNRWGIAVAYTAYHDKFTTAALDDAMMLKYSATNVIVEGNYVKDAGGDSITLMYADRPIVQNNVSDGAARQINGKDYSETGAGRVAAAVWPWKTKNAIFQFNEVFDTNHNQDGQAWDADYGDGTVYQYNFSYNNAGGAIMFCGHQAINNIFRYNISFEDLSGVMNPAGNPDAHVYNNTFIIKEGVDFIRTNMAGGGMVVENNIIYYNGSTPKQENWNKEEGSYGYNYDNNLYFNYLNTPEEDTKAITDNPKFAGDVNSAPRKTNGIRIYDRTAFQAFKIQDDSPAVNKGKYVSGHATTDFFGNRVGRFPDIGAHETSVKEDFVLDVVSSIYTVNESSITNIPFNTEVATFLENLTHSNGITLVVKDSDDQEVTGVLSNGDTLYISGSDKTRPYALIVNEENISIASSIYDVSENEISNVYKNTPIKTFLSKLTSQTELVYTITRGEDVLDETDSILDRDVLTVKGSSGNEHSYLINSRKEFIEINPSSLVATTGSFQPNNQTEGNADLAIDGKLNTMWHTDWSGTARENIWITLDMGAAKEVSMYKYVPRTMGGTNGIITKYEIQVSDDNVNWDTVSSGTWSNNNSTKFVSFDKVTTRYVKLVAVESISQNAGMMFGSAAEIRVGNFVEEVLINE